MADASYLEEGLIDAVLARGPVWRDPRTGKRAVIADYRGPMRSALPTRTPMEGDSNGRDGA